MARERMDRGGQRAAESIARAKGELDEALKEIDALRTFDPSLVGLVAHALSNYITVTSAGVEMLQKTLREHSDSDVRIWLDGIGHAADLMQHSVGRLVSMSAPRDFPMKLDYVNLPVLLERACDYYRRRPASGQVQITCRSSGDVPLAWGDRVAIAVVVDNLMSNAVRASQPKGSVAVDVTGEIGHVVFGVRDSGPGLTPLQRERIFHVTTGAESTSAHGIPEGYGLAVASEFVQRMDGEMWCESEPGEGARFFVRLPALE